MKYFDFDKNNVIGADTLTPDQIAYIKKPSLTILAPFNALLRSHWDILAYIIVFTFIDDNFSHNFNYPFFETHPWIVYLFFYSIVAIYGVIHGRRLAWNRNNWISFDEFQKSERNWFKLFVISVALSAIYLISILFFYYSTQPQ